MSLKFLSATNFLPPPPYADHIVVLYAGWVVEQGGLQSVLLPPYHLYTRLLLSSVPELRSGCRRIP